LVEYTHIIQSGPDYTTTHNLIGILGIKQGTIDVGSSHVDFLNEIPYYAFWIDGLGLFSGSGSLTTNWFRDGGSSGPFTCAMDPFVLEGDLRWDIVSFNVDFLDENGVAFNKYGPPTDYYSQPTSFTLKEQETNSNFYIEFLNFTKIASVPEANTTILFVFAIIVSALFMIFYRRQANNNTTMKNMK